MAATGGRSKSDNDSGKSLVPEDAVVIDLTDDGDEDSLTRPPPPKRLKVSGSSRSSVMYDSSGRNSSREREEGPTVIDLTELDGMDLDELWHPKRKRQRALSEESSMFIDQSSADDVQVDGLDATTDDDSAASRLNSPALRDTPLESRLNWRTPPPISPKQPFSGTSLSGITTRFRPPDEIWTFSPEPSDCDTTEEQTAENIETISQSTGTYDTCFGMLLLDAETSHGVLLPKQCTPVAISFNGAMAKLRLLDQDICTAVLMSGPLCRLADQFTIKLTVTICGRRLKQARKPRDADYQEPPPPCPVRIFVYGLMDEGDAVGDVLSEAGLFLQHPGEHEIDNRVKYHNPQYLLSPGQIMPSIETLNVSMCCRPQTDKDEPFSSSLGELERGQVLKIFDSAYEVPSTDSIEPSTRLQTRLKRHQLEALTMMVEKEAGIYDNASFPPLWKPFSGHDGRYEHVVTGKFAMEKPPPVGGGILADEMGLGKTLSTLSLICYSLDALDRLPASAQRKVPRATLVVAPKSTLYGWEKQIQTHIYKGRVRLIVYHGQGRHQELQKSAPYDIVLTTYDTLRSDWAKEGPLFDQEWARVVLDEAHKIRNRASKAFQAVFSIAAQKRWCLTGTPIQNSLADFGALLSFVGVPPFEEAGSFAHLVANPVAENAEGSFDILRKLVAATTLRRTKAYHSETLGLPRKIEREETVELKGRDKQLYEFFKRRSYLIATLERSKVAAKQKGKARSGGGGGVKGSSILVLIGLLRLICNHGEALLPESAVKAWRNQDSNAIDWEMLDSGVDKCVCCGSEVESLDAAEFTMGQMPCGHSICTNCATKSQTSRTSCPRCGRSASSPSLTPSLQYLTLPAGSRSPSKSIASPRSPSILLKKSSSSPFAERYVSSDKVEALLRNINNGDRGAKHVIFSYWTKMLDQIARALKMEGLKSRRIDGQASLQQRKEALEKFGNDASCNVMLASVGAAGEGIDLTAATAVHIVEPHWNPMAEAQAVDRVHRIGQKSDVTVIRYVVSDSIEGYVQWVQAHKLRLIKDSLSATDQVEKHIVETRYKKMLEYLV